MAIPLLNKKIVKNRIKKFIRPQSDRRICVKEIVPAVAENGKGNGAAAKLPTFSTLKPHLIVEAPHAADAISFYQRVFGAEEIEKSHHSQRKADQELPLILHAHLKFGSAEVMVCDEAEEAGAELAAGVEETEEDGSDSFSGESEPAIWDRINVENRRRVRQVLNPSRRRLLDLKIGSQSNSRDLRVLRLLGDSPPSLWCRNLVKRNAGPRIHSEYRGKTSSETTASFPLFIKTIAGSSICLQAQDSVSVFELKTQIHQATGIPPGFQRLIFEGRQLGDGSLLRDYGNLKNATISLTSRLRGGAPSATHPSSYKQAVKSGTSAPSGFKAEASKVNEPFGSAFIVEQCAEPPTTEVEDPQVYGYAFLYQAKALICRFNGLWPSAPALKEWVNKTWSEGHELFFCSKGFFIVNFSTEAECQRVLEQGPWFWGRSGLSMQRWFPEFNPLTMTAMTTPVWVRLPNLPLHFYSASFLPTLGNALGRFIKIDTDRITKGFVTFARLCVEIDLSQGLPDRILIDWGDGDPFIQMVDYENTAFRCRSCQQTGHLQATCPLSPIPPSTSGARKRANGWQGPKSHKSRPNPSSDNKQHHKDAPTPTPSSRPSQAPTLTQQPTVDPKHQPAASAQNPADSEVMIPTPAVKSLHPPHEKGETIDTIMITASLPGTQKRPHESDNSDSDKEAPLNSVAQDYGTSLDHLALVVKAAEPTSSSGWIDVRKKKGRKDPPRPTQ
jgi:hypothetical protein